MEFKCKQCKKIFLTHYKLKRHINDRKTECTPKQEKLKCKYCKKRFARVDSVKRHYNTCKTKLKYNNTLNNIVSFNKECVAIIKIREKIFPMIIMVEAIKKNWRAIPFLIKHMNFNINFPQYHNIYLASLTKIYCHIFEKGGWHLCNVEIAIDMLVDIVVERIMDYLMEEKVDQEIIEQFLIIFHTYEKIRSVRLIDDEDSRILENKILFKTIMPNIDDCNIKFVSKKRYWEIKKMEKEENKIKNKIHKKQCKNMINEIKFLMYENRKMIKNN